MKTEPENIHFGLAWVPWARETKTFSGVWCRDGWVLPGGRRTANREEAIAAAAVIDRLLRGVEPEHH